MAVTVSETSSAFSRSQLAASLPYFAKVVRDNVSDKTPLLSFLMGELGRGMRSASGLDGGSIPGVITGGSDIRVPVQLKNNQTVRSYSGADHLDISHQDTDDYALAPIKQIAGSYALTGREIRANKGESSVYPHAQAAASRLVQDLREDLNRQCTSDGTGNGGKDLTGLAAIINTGTLFGLSPTTYPKWQPGGFASGNARHARNASVGSYATGGIAEWRKQRQRLSWGTDALDMIMVASDVERFYADTIDGNIRYTTVSVGDADFKTLEFHGIRVMFDHAIPDGVAYFLNSRHIEFIRDTAADFAWLEDARPADQDVFVRTMIVEGNLVTDNRRTLGINLGITA